MDNARLLILFLPACLRAIFKTTKIVIQDLRKMKLIVAAVGAGGDYFDISSGTGAVAIRSADKKRPAAGGAAGQGAQRLEGNAIIVCWTSYAAPKPEFHAAE